MDKEKRKILLIAFGTRLREIREGKGFTQEKLANDSGIEISQISRIERGAINTTVVTLYNICRVLKINPGDLFE